MIERVVETQRVVTEGGVSETTLADRLNQLENKLRALIFSQSSQQSAQTSAVSHAVALSQRIDNLSNTTITNPTITGGSITGSSIVGTISSAISTALATIDDLTTTELVAVNATFTNATSTTFYAGALGAGTASITNATTTNLDTANLRVSSLDCTGYANGGTLTTDASGNVVCATDDGGAGSSVAGSDTQVQFNSGGGFAAAASFTFASSSGKLAVPYASTTALTATTLYATTASTTNLTVSSSTQTNSITVNGFATSTFNGGINLATGCFSVNGTCITSGSAADGTFSTTSADWWRLQSNFFSTTSVNAWEATQWRWSTSSALGFEATQWRWSTTSSDYWLTQQNVSAFSTTSADYWDTTKFRWATTSSDYWKSVNNFFSTTSANAWEATQWRWATTSANYFESTQWRWATSSSNNAVNVFINGSTTIPKTFSANTFTALQTFGAAASTSALTISNIQNGILSTNATGGVVATTSIGFNYLAGTLGVGQGGTGSTTLGGILKGNGTGIIQTAIAGTDYLTGSGISGNCVKWGANNTLTDALAPCGSGGGSGGGTWATTTSQVAGQLINYPLNSTDIVAIGASGTSSAKFWFDPNTLSSYFSGTANLTYASSTAISATALYANAASTSNLYLSGTNNALLITDGAGKASGIATSSLGLLTTDIAEGANQYYTSARVQTYLDTLYKGYFFATTSADYWDATKWRWSTSSSNYFESMQTRWATSSANFFEINADTMGNNVVRLLAHPESRASIFHDERPCVPRHQINRRHRAGKCEQILRDRALRHRPRGDHHRRAARGRNQQVLHRRESGRPHQRHLLDRHAHERPEPLDAHHHALWLLESDGRRALDGSDQSRKRHNGHLAGGQRRHRMGQHRRLCHSVRQRRRRSRHHDRRHGRLRPRISQWRSRVDGHHDIRRTALIQQRRGLHFGGQWQHQRLPFERRLECVQY